MTEIREPLDELADDDDFWAEQARSLAVFAASESLRTFRLPNRLTARSRSATAPQGGPGAARRAVRPRAPTDPRRRGAAGLDLPLAEQLPAPRRAGDPRQPAGGHGRRARGRRARDPRRGLRARDVSAPRPLRLALLPRPRIRGPRDRRPRRHLPHDRSTPSDRARPEVSRGAVRASGSAARASAGCGCPRRRSP
jgi:hypothetical protein